MKKLLTLIFVLLLSLFVFAACDTAEPVVTPEPTAEPTATPEPTPAPTPTPEPTATPEPTPTPAPGTYDIFALYGIGDPETCDADGLLRNDWKVNVGEALCWGGTLSSDYGGIDPETEDATREVVETELSDGSTGYAIRVCCDSEEGNYCALWNDIYNFPGLLPDTTYKLTVKMKLTGSPQGKAALEKNPNASDYGELRPCIIYCLQDKLTQNENAVKCIVDGEWHTYEYVFTTKNELPTLSTDETYVDFNIGPVTSSAFMYINFEILVESATLYELVPEA